jgi:hypothetical protein
MRLPGHCRPNIPNRLRHRVNGAGHGWRFRKPPKWGLCRTNLADEILFPAPAAHQWAGVVDPDLNPVPPQRWHFTFLSPCLTRPLPSQFLHFTFFLSAGFAMLASRFNAAAYSQAMANAAGKKTRRERTGWAMPNCWSP